MNSEQVAKIRSLEKHVRIAQELDREATVRGCGISAYECGPLLNAFLEILELPQVEPTEDELNLAEQSGEY